MRKRKRRFNIKQAVVGVIAEYNPFHTGHRYHLDEARRLADADQVLVVMSGPFTQRGDPALFSPRARAEMALLSGADMVFELPALYAVNDADRFATGGVNLLTSLGCTHISFGCEDLNQSLFQRAVALITEPEPSFQQNLRSALSAGRSYPFALGNALAAALGTNALALPNNILALSYSNAIHQYKSPLIPIPIRRSGSYHSLTTAPGVLPSAAALRRAVLTGNWPGIQMMTEPAVMRIIERELQRGLVHFPGSLDMALRTMLLTADPCVFNALPNVSEGLDRLILKYREHAVSRDELLGMMKSKRYTHARLSRLLTHFMLGITAEMMVERPRYARLLGFKQRATEHIRFVKRSGFSIIEKAARYDREDPEHILDMRAYDLWAMGVREPFGYGWRQSPLVDPTD